MLRFLQRSCNYCTKIANYEINQLAGKKNRETIDFHKLNHKTKVPQEPIQSEFPESTGEVQIDGKTIQLLERLSLVDLDSKESLEVLKSSIQFADKIAHIDTENVKPLYTVLEWQQLHLRNDAVTEGDCRSEVLRNAKVTDEDYFVAPPGNIPLEQEDKSFTDKQDN